MANKFVVAYMNFFENTLKQLVVEAEDWKDALSKGEPLGYEYSCYSHCKDLDEVGELSFNCDEQLTCIEVL